MTCTVDYHLLIIILIMLVTGAFGGFLNHLHNFDTILEIEVKRGKAESETDFNRRQKKFKTNRIWKYTLLGVGASLLVPTFLKTISSKLAEPSNNNTDYLVFAGFCMVAAIFSRRFVQGIGEKLLEKVKEAKNEATEAKNQAVEAKEIAAKSEDLVTVVTNSVTETDELPNDDLETTLSNSQDLAQTSAGVVITPEMRKKVVALLNKSGYVFRTLKGIARGTDMLETTVEIILSQLIGAGVVLMTTKRQGIDQRVVRLFSLTATGRLLNPE